ncbi:hypothetical protein JCM19235_1287 [Vibrio maritimus]|uniref:Uncharacterized protein n=1 Tax=Vibrio maritimus TaxID=990268 RepID=A0A090S641_9VIBR|nr:hypothetical protein JCM19235_1287 [Vibrio maritimus]
MQQKHDIASQAIIESLAYACIVANDTVTGDDLEQAVMLLTGRAVDQIRVYCGKHDTITVSIIEGEATCETELTYSVNDIPALFKRVLANVSYWYYYDVETKMKDEFVSRLFPIVEKHLKSHF